LILLCGQRVLAQQVVFAVNATGGSSNGSSCFPLTNTITVTLKNSSGTVVGSYTTTGSNQYHYTPQPVYIIYSANITSGWQGTISASGSLNGGPCGSAGASITEQPVTFNSNQCNNYSFSQGFSFNYQISLSLAIYAPIGALAVDNSYQNCGNTSVSFNLTSPQHPGSLFDWQVSENNATWRTFRTNTLSSITADINELNHASFTTSKYSTRYIRAVGTNCPSYRTSSSVTVSFLPPQPIVSVISKPPTCNNFANGGFNITIASPEPAYLNDFIIRIYDDSNNPIPLSQSTITDGFYIEMGNFGHGTYDIKVTHGSDGSCFTWSYDNVLTNPTAVQANFTSITHVSCHGDPNPNGQVTVSPSGGTGSYKEYSWSNGATTQTISSLAAGTYTVSFKDTNDCPASGSIPITQPSPLVVSLTPAAPLAGYEVSCDGKNDGSITASASGSVGGYSYQWTNGPSTATHPNLSAGKYVVTVKDANNCTKKDSTILTAAPKLNFTLNKTNNTCAGASEGSVSVDILSLVNVVGSPIYNWSVPGNTGSSLDNRLQGTYTVTVTDDRGPQCNVSKSETLVDPAGYSVALSSPTPYNGKVISCKGAANGTLQTTVTNNATSTVVTTGLAYKWFKNGSDLNVSSNSINDLAEGTYKVEVTYNTSCKTEQTLFLDDPEPVAPFIAPDTTYNGLLIRCSGESNAKLIASATGGTGPYQYKWGTAPAFVSDPTLNDIGAGTYLVAIKDVNGCDGTNSITINDPSPVAPSIALDSAITCFGKADAKITATGAGGSGILLGYTYLWNTGETTATINKLAAGTYTVTVRDKNTCPGVTSLVITNPSVATAAINALSNFNGQTISCNGSTNGRLQAIGAGGTGTFTYEWSTGSTAAIVSGLPAGTYTVTAKDANLCPATASFSITNPDQVMATITETSDFNGFGISCAGGTNGYLKAAGAGGTGTLSYQWLTTTETSNTLSNRAAGTYTVRVQDVNGCFDTETRTLTQSPTLTLSLLTDKDISCFNGSDGEIQLTATGGVSGYEYSRDGNTWQPAPSFTTLPAQSYTLRVRDANACVSTLANTLTQPTQLAIAFTNIEPAYCSDPRGKARAVVSGGTGAYRYEWRNAANTVFDTDATVENLAPGVYTLTSLDANDCPVSNAIGIVSADGPQVSVNSVTAPLCSYSSDGSATVAVNGSGPFTYAWPNGQTTAQVTGVAQGTYIVSVRDVNNCLTTQSVSVTAPEPLAITLAESQNPTCFGDANGRLKVSGSGGVGGYLFTWGTQPGSEVTGLVKGDYTVILTDANACTTQQIFSLDEPEPLQVNMTNRILPLCFNGQDGVLEATALGGNGQYNYTWSNGATSYRADALRAGNYTVTVTDVKSCTTSQTFSIGQPDQLQIRLLDNQSPDCHDGCNGELSVDAIGGTGSLSWLWNTNATTSGIANICAGDYEVIVTDAHACKTTAIYSVINPDELQIDLGGSVTLCVGQTHVLDPGSGWAEYAWTSNTGLTSNSQSITIRDPGEYRLEVKNALGCIAQDIFLLETSRDLLKASFMIPKEAFVNDTIVMIDISWPLPQSIAWSFPSEMKKVLDLGDVVYGQFVAEGTYNITMATQLGECRDVIGKSITILANEEDELGAGLGFEEFVKTFELFPNPSSGTFEVNVEMMKEEAVTLSIWNPVNARMVMRQSRSEALSHIANFDLTDLGPGTYVIRLDHARGTKYIRFIVY
jgi:hypothetical protein